MPEEAVDQETAGVPTPTTPTPPFGWQGWQAAMVDYQRNQAAQVAAAKEKVVARKDVWDGFEGGYSYERHILKRDIDRPETPKTCSFCQNPQLWGEERGVGLEMCTTCFDEIKEYGVPKGVGHGEAHGAYRAENQSQAFF